MKKLIQSIKDRFNKIFNSAKEVEAKIETKIEVDANVIRKFYKDEEERLKARAEKIIEDVHEFEHTEQMRWMSLLHNWGLMAFTFFLVLLVSKWFVFALLLWDFPFFHKKK